MRAPCIVYETLAVQTSKVRAGLSDLSEELDRPRSLLQGEHGGLKGILVSFVDEEHDSLAIVLRQSACLP